MLLINVTCYINLYVLDAVPLQLCGVPMIFTCNIKALGNMYIV